MDKRALYSLAFVIRLAILVVGAGLIIMDRMISASENLDLQRYTRRDPGGTGKTAVEQVREAAAVPVWFDPVASDASVVKAVQEAKKNKKDIDVRNEAGYTGLMRAIIDFIFPRVQLFIEHGADVNARVKNNSKQDSDTPLLLASRFPPHATIALYLLENGANPRLVNKKNETPFHKLLEMHNYAERLKLARALVKYGVDINYQNSNGNTMIHVAVQRMDKKWIDIMRREFGSILNLNLRNNEGFTPLEYAQNLGMVGDDSVEMYLLKNYGVVGEGYGGYRERTGLGQNPLMLAVERGDEPFVRDMMRKAVPANEVDNRGRSALFYAVESDSPKQFIPIILGYGTDINTQDREGKTALMLVPNMRDSKKRIETAELLIKNGANPWLSDRNGNTVWHEATRQGDVELLQAMNSLVMTATKNVHGETPVSIVKNLLKSPDVDKQEKERLEQTLKTLTGQPR